VRHGKAPLILVLAYVAAVRTATPNAAGVEQDPHSPIPTCPDTSLPHRVERLLKPVLMARAAGLQAREDWDKPYEEEFYKLLERKGPDALEAQVALMAYYTGEHYGHELLEALLGHPAQVDPLVRRYRACRPRVTFEDRLIGVVVLRTLYDMYEGERGPRK